jgi:hypothetical protein
MIAPLVSSNSSCPFVLFLSVIVWLSNLLALGVPGKDHSRSAPCALRRVWRYQREVIRIRISKKNRQHNGI